MSAKQFNYFDDWKNEVLECPSCHWKGRFDQGSVEHYMDQMDSTCPKCDVSQSPILAVVLYPTLPELRANMDKPGVREWVEGIDRGFDEFEAQKLREPSQLPDIAESSFELVWDFDNSNPDDRRTVLKHGDAVVFSEPARYEEFKRFGEVCEILSARYGDSIKDLVPTLRSEEWLYGAVSEAKNFVGWFRLHYFGASIAKQWQLRSETESLVRSLSLLELANQRTEQDDSHPQLALNFEAKSGQSHAQQPDEETPNAYGTIRPVPGVPGASWERTEDGTVLRLEPNTEFDALPKEVQSKVLDRMLKCFDKPNHIQRVTALRDEFANGIADKTQRQPDEWPSAYSHSQYGPELPEIDAPEFSLVFDYSHDGSKYFVLYGEQVILSGPAADDPEDHVTDNAVGGQFIEIAKKLKTRYGAKLVDLVPTPKAENMLMDLWGWALKRDGGRKIAQQRSIPSESHIALKVDRNDLESRHRRGPFHTRTHTKRVISFLVGCALVLGAFIAWQYQQRQFPTQPAPAREQSAQSTAPSPHPSTQVFDSAKWAAANPGKDVNKAIAKARGQGYRISPPPTYPDGFVPFAQDPPPCAQEYPDGFIPLDCSPIVHDDDIDLSAGLATAQRKGLSGKAAKYGVSPIPSD